MWGWLVELPANPATYHNHPPSCVSSKHTTMSGRETAYAQCANRGSGNTLVMMQSHWVQTKLAPETGFLPNQRSQAGGGEEMKDRAPWLQGTYSLVGKLGRP